MLSRRNFLGLVPGTIVGATIGPAMALAPQGEAKLYPEFPAQEPAKVMAVVGASHRDLDRVKALVTASPALAKAAWDWGYGDWETALGAASHVGRHDIAEYLIANGARPDIFTFAMMGNVDAVKAAVAASPGIQKLYGPHSINLMRHAEAGGDKAKAVVDYLKSIGGADVAPTNLPLTDEEKAIYVGKYAFGKEASEVFDITINRQGSLTIQRMTKTACTLFRVEEHGFTPGGAPSVRVRFTVQDGKTLSLTVHDPMPIVTANKS